MTNYTIVKQEVPVHLRPICKTPGCKNKGQHTGLYNKNGYPFFRAYCLLCHTKRGENFRKLLKKVDRRSLPKCAMFGCKKHITVNGTTIKGKLKFSSFCKDHAGSPNGYSIFRKTYCENTDGRLGFECTTNVQYLGMLQVDHIDGDPSNNAPDNLQTLCACCHAYKTYVFGDVSSPGRKALGIR